MKRTKKRTNNYRAGYKGEKKVRRLLESWGFYVVESRGSHGLIDIVAWDYSVMRFISVKVNDYLPKNERAKLEKLEYPIGRNSVEFWRIIKHKNIVIIEDIKTGYKLTAKLIV